MLWLKKGHLNVLVLAGVVLLAGCATGRNYQSDIDALNSRISALQGQLSSKDDEIARLQGQLSQAEAEKQRLATTLSKPAAAASKPQESDLK